LRLSLAQWGVDACIRSLKPAHPPLSRRLP
jgi:hypothetical protein